MVCNDYILFHTVSLLLLTEHWVSRLSSLYYHDVLSFLCVCIIRTVITGKVTKVLALPLFAGLVLAGPTFKNKVPFYTKQVINKSARVIFGLLYYSTVNREAVSRVGKLSAAHMHDLFQCSEGAPL